MLLSLNTGTLGRIQVLQDILENSGSNYMIGLKDLDYSLYVKANKKSEEVTKKARTSIRNKKRKVEDLENEDEIYTP